MSVGIHQKIMDNAYSKWQTEFKGKEYTEFITELTSLERQAVVVGNFNYQVENGGIGQWIGNDYATGLEYLKGALLDIGTQTSHKVLDMLEHFDEYIEEDDYLMNESNYKYLRNFDSPYYKVNEVLMSDTENYFQDMVMETLKDLGVLT